VDEASLPNYYPNFTLSDKMILIELVYILWTWTHLGRMFLSQIDAGLDDPWQFFSRLCMILHASALWSYSKIGHNTGPNHLLNPSDPPGVTWNHLVNGRGDTWPTNKKYQSTRDPTAQHKNNIDTLGPALASLFWVSVDFPELFLKTSELFLKSFGPVEKGQELFLKILGNPQSYS